MKINITKTKSVGILFTGLALIFISYLFFTPKVEVMRVYTRNDGAFSVALVRYVPRFSIMPGQGSDAPGYIEIRDSRGNVLAKKDVDMVQLVENVEWVDSRVVIKNVGEWEVAKQGLRSRD